MYRFETYSLPWCTNDFYICILHFTPVSAFDIDKPIVLVLVVKLKNIVGIYFLGSPNLTPPQCCIRGFKLPLKISFTTVSLYFSKILFFRIIPFSIFNFSFVWEALRAHTKEKLKMLKEWFWKILILKNHRWKIEISIRLITVIKLQTWKTSSLILVWNGEVSKCIGS